MPPVFVLPQWPSPLSASWLLTDWRSIGLIWWSYQPSESSYAMITAVLLHSGRSLEHFNIGKDLIPREMITAYAILKKGSANANFAGKRLDQKRHDLIVQVCDEILAGQHHDMFPLHVWMTGSGTQFNMNVNEVISNRCCQIAGTPLGSKTPVHPNDHINMSQSSNDSFPSAMNIAAAVNVKQRLMPAVKQLHDAIAAKVSEWNDIVKIGRTRMQDATPLTLGQRPIPAKLVWKISAAGHAALASCPRGSKQVVPVS
jgi:fumarate hydratase class II